MELFGSALAPFTIALMLMALIALVEVAGLFLGFSVMGESGSDAMDGPVETDAIQADPSAAGALEQMLAWLGVGRVPVLILIAAFLLGFGLTGLLLQNFMKATIGLYLHVFIATPIAFLAALPITRFLGLAFARFLPKEETDAVSTASFVGRIAVIVRGEARVGLPAEAKLKDGHGATHYVLVEPDDAETSFPAGCVVLLTEKAGAVFRAIRNPSAALTAAGA